MTKTQDTAPAMDISTLSVSELAALLAKAREADKAKKAQESSLPMFAFAVIMEDGTVTQWSGRAVDYIAAQAQAVTYAERNGDKAFYYEGNASVTPRPIPGPRGRKAKATEEVQG
jgi:hypothetical protein